MAECSRIFFTPQLTTLQLQCKVSNVIGLFLILIVLLLHFSSAHRDPSQQIIYLEHQARGLTHIHVFNLQSDRTAVCSSSVPPPPSIISADIYSSSRVCREKHSLSVTSTSTHWSLSQDQTTAGKVLQFLRQIRFIAYV